MEQLPKVHPNIILEQASMDYFKSKLPKNWIVQQPKHDYGQDLIVEIAQNGKLTGNDLAIQLKASVKPSGSPECENVDIKVSTYNYLMKNVIVTLIVKYIEQEKEAYWVYLRDCPRPRTPQQKKLRIHIPRSNRLSRIDWDKEVSRIIEIYKIKLQSARGL